MMSEEGGSQAVAYTLEGGILPFYYSLQQRLVGSY